MDLHLDRSGHQGHVFRQVDRCRASDRSATYDQEDQYEGQFLELSKDGGLGGLHCQGDDFPMQ